MMNNKFIKLFSCLIIFLFVISFTSALEWDNVGDYDEETKTMTIVNALGLGSDIAKIKLDTPIDKKVGIGYNKVAQFTITQYSDYNNALKELELFDKRKGMNKFFRNYDYKVLSYKDKEVEDSYLECGDNYLVEGCERIVTGSHIEQEEIWTKLTPSDFKKNDIVTIGIFTDVKPNDYVEWIPNIMGVRIDEWATWVGQLSVNLIHSYALNESSGTVSIDDLDSQNGTNVGMTVNQPGKLGTGYLNDGSNNYIDFSGITSTTQNYTISLWMNTTSTGGANRFILDFEGGRISPTLTGSSGGELGIFDGTFVNSGATPTLNIWEHYVWVFDGSRDKCNLYVDGVVQNEMDCTVPNLGGVVRFANPFDSSAQDFVASFDNLQIWERHISGAEVLLLYNEGNGCAYLNESCVPTFPPTINLNAPVDTYNATSQTINFNATVFDSSAVNNVTFYLNNTVNGTNSSGINNSLYNFERTLAGGNYTWIIGACDDEGECANSTQRSIFVNTSIGTNIINPINTTRFNTSTITFTIDSIPININLTDVSINLWFLNGTFVLTNTTSITGFSDVQTNFTNTLADGVYIWNAQTDGIGESNITGNNTFEVHTTPSSVIINFPTGTIDSFVFGQNLTLNWTIQEPGQNLTEHIKNCSYTYNGIQTFLPNVSVCININETTFLYVEGVNELTFIVEEEFNLTTTNTTSWSFQFLELNQTFNSPVVELSTQDFSLLANVTGSVISANLIYNGTSHSANIFDLGEGLTNITSSFQIPSFQIDTNVTFFYNISMLSGSIITTQNQTQEVFILFIGNCTAFSNVMFNLSLFDEKVLTPIFGTIEVDVEILNAQGQQISNKSTDFFNISTASVCTNLNLTEASNLYNLELRYFVDPLNNSNFIYAPEFYHIQKAQTSNLPQEIDLFDLNINESTEFTIFYRDNDYISRPNVLLQIERKYVDEGLFRTVEIPITSSEGSTTAHFDLNNYKYKIIATENGDVLNVFDNPAIACESELSGICTLSLNGQGSPNPLENVETINDIASVITTNGTDITVDYVIPSGETKEVTIAMIQTSPFEDPITLCNQTVSSSAGSLTCSASSTIGDSQIFIEIDSEESIIGRANVYFQEDLGDFFLLNNYAIASFFVILLITMVVSSPMIMTIAATFSVGFLGFIFLLKGSSIGLVLGSITWLIICGILILIKINKKDET